MIYILQLIFSLCSCDDAQADQHQGGHGGGLLDGHRAVAKNIGIIWDILNGHQAVAKIIGKYWDILGYFEWARNCSQEYYCAKIRLHCSTNSSLRLDPHIQRYFWPIEHIISSCCRSFLANTRKALVMPNCW